MSKSFQIPDYYRSSLISRIKAARRKTDHYKKDFSPSIIDLGAVRFKLARHFGFCYGVENAIEITYRAVEENSDRRIFLLSEMIHNPHVNADLRKRGVAFIMDTAGRYLIPWEELTREDIVIIPAFGAQSEMFEKLREIGIDPLLYNATCPFVEKVWKRSRQLGEKGYTVIIHGKHSHEETRATFSHARKSGKSLIVRDIEETRTLADYIRGKKSMERFFQDFPNRASEGFDPEQDLRRIGVVNQTTMLAQETQEISRILKEAIQERFQNTEGFANTQDTLCYATSENQTSMNALIETRGDIAIIVGGYNSSNTSHLAELCEGRLPSFYIQDADEILDENRIRCLDLKTGEVRVMENWLPRTKTPPDFLIAAGASCPDALVDAIILKIASLFNALDRIEEAMAIYNDE